MRAWPDQGSLLRLRRYRDSSNVRASEVRASEVGASQIGSFQAGVPQAGTPETTVLQLAAPQGRAVCLCTVKIFMRELEAIHIRAIEICAAEVCFLGHGL